MNFNSLHFLIFLPIVVLVYHILPQKCRPVWLLAASYYFYMSWNPLLIFLILGTTGLSYGAGLLIERAKSERGRKLWLSLALIGCLGVLVFFKYFQFLADSVCAVLRWFLPQITSPALNLVLPIGISFYTFQTLAYVIDVYRGKFKAEKNIIYFALFVSFFPQLVAGPIERPNDLIPQLRAEHKCNAEDMETGFKLLFSGFIRKCVIADTVGVMVNSVFADLSSANSLAILLAGVLFMIQMYCDFAGYSEIAAGAARMMGIKLSQNFASPLLAVNYRDFFRRWHITLNQWFTDYLYIPLGGNRKGRVRQILNTFIVFAICGLWHGAGWNYVLWGLYVALFITLETLLKKPAQRLAEKMKLDTETAEFTLVRRLLFILSSVPATLLFRSQSVAQAGEGLKGLFTRWGIGTEYFNQTLSAMSASFTLIVAVIVFIVCLYFLGKWISEKDFYQRGKTDSDEMTVRPLLNAERRAPLSCRLSTYFFGAVAVLLGWMLLISNSSISSFVYFQF